jgi:hypothetical protein
MISTLTSFSVPSQTITALAAGGLLIILTIMLFLDKSSHVKRYFVNFGLFAAPLLVFLGFAALSYIFRVLSS